jgi:hypothetical protein
MKALILLLLAFPALAADSWSTASSYSQASAQAGAVAGAISGGNTFQGGSYKEQKQAPAVFAPSIAPTAPCMGGTSAGGSGTGFGLSFGTSWTDDECNTRETARLFHSLGMASDALSVLCSSAYAAAAPSCAGREKPCHADEIVARRLGVGVCK